MSLKTKNKFQKEKISKLTKYQNDIKNALNMAQTFAEYFLIIGIDPQISMRTYLYDIQNQMKFSNFIQMKSNLKYYQNIPQ